MNSGPIFLDTSGWLALVDAREANHSAALGLWREVGRRRRPVVLTDWVVAESGNGLARPPSRLSFLSILGDLMRYPGTEFVFLDRGWFDRVINFYAARPDKAWGLVDCASFVVMAEMGVREALTADHHFEQAGFRALLAARSS